MGMIRQHKIKITHIVTNDLVVSYATTAFNRPGFAVPARAIITHKETNDFALLFPSGEFSSFSLGKIQELTNSEINLCNLFIYNRLRSISENYPPSHDWFPPYHTMIQYSDSMYQSKEVERLYGLSAETIVADDLSRCKTWEDFIACLNYCMMKQFASLEKGGRMFVLMGDMKKNGKLYSMLTDCAKIGTLEQIIIKQQHNCVSDGREYAGRFVPIVHEYLLVTRKDSGLIIPVQTYLKRDMDIRDSNSASWRDILFAVIQEHKEMSLEQLYETMQNSKKIQNNPNWQAKIRQTVQNTKYFKRTSRGCYAVAS